MERSSYEINQLLMQHIKCRKNEGRKSFGWQGMRTHSHNPPNEETKIDLINFSNDEISERERETEKEKRVPD